MTWKGDAWNPDPVEELMRDERRYGQEPDTDDEVAEQYESDLAEAAKYGSLSLAKRIDKIMTTMTNESRLWRIRQLIDEVFRGEDA
jgi:hypothetical protein